MRQIGNAVPVLLAEKIGCELAKRVMQYGKLDSLEQSIKTLETEFAVATENTRRDQCHLI